VSKKVESACTETGVLKATMPTLRERRRSRRSRKKSLDERFVGEEERLELGEKGNSQNPTSEEPYRNDQPKSTPSLRRTANQSGKGRSIRFIHFSEDQIIHDIPD